MTGGRTASAKLDLRFVTLVQRNPDVAIDGTMPSEKVLVVGLTTKPISVAEIAAELNLVVGVVNVLIEDLVESGHVEVFLDDGAGFDDDDELDMLTRISDKIRSL
jgi:hypothetical protein